MQGQFVRNEIVQQIVAPVRPWRTGAERFVSQDMQHIQQVTPRSKILFAAEALRTDGIQGPDPRQMQLGRAIGLAGDARHGQIVQRHVSASQRR